MSLPLVLVPTPLEEERLTALGGFPGARVERCGFGVVAAAARGAQLLAGYQPARVLLVGLAGTLDPARAPLGSAAAYGRARLDGLGAGEGERCLPPSALGLPQWQDAGESIHETLELRGPGEAELLTVCAASDSPQVAARRRRRFPEARVEEMEGFAVALACRLAGVPLTIVRGVSNEAGDRAHERWRLREALEAARALALALLAAEPPA